MCPKGHYSRNYSGPVSKRPPFSDSWSRPVPAVDSRLVQSPDGAIDQLVERVRSRAAYARDPEVVRAAFTSVLADLGVRPGDPAWTDGRDVIGAAYERLLSGRERRALGQFFTPLPIGRGVKNRSEEHTSEL